jgi:2-hydroxychromene-2-carboxylate isomerase
MPLTATFFFDVGSPYAYLAAERVDSVLPGGVAWQPVSLGALFKLTGRSSWALGDYRRRRAGMAEIERRARAYGLPPLRWPAPWPSHYLLAMRAATFAFRAGDDAGRAFALAAFRLAFTEGRDLALAANVREAGRRAGLDPDALEAATQDPAIKDALRAATAAAHERGAFGVPAVAVGGELFWGDDRLEDAAAALQRSHAA